VAFVLLGHFSPLRDKTNLKFQRLVQERAEILICIKEFKRHERDGGLSQELAARANLRSPEAATEVDPRVTYEQKVKR
jgi:hypothetical protein